MSPKRPGREKLQDRDDDIAELNTLITVVKVNVFIKLAVDFDEVFQDKRRLVTVVLVDNQRSAMTKAGKDIILEKYPE
jgi:hypothetical protein